MPTLDTSDFLSNNGLWTHTTQALQEYAANNVNAYTVKQTDNGSNINSSLRFWSCGTPHVQNINVIADSHGESQRPSQYFSFADDVQHTHFIIDVEQIRVYRTAINEGDGVTSFVPTGVIGLHIETYKIAADINNTFQDPNNASPDIDLYIYDASDTSKWVEIHNFPLNTLGVAAGSQGYNTVLWSWISRGGLGTAHYAISQLTHNIGASQQTWNNWTIQELAAETGKLGVAYRIHSVVAPFTLSHNVPALNAASAIGEEVDEPEPDPIALTASGTIRFTGVSNNPVTEPEIEQVMLTAEDDIQLRGSSAVNTTQNHPSLQAVGGIRLSPADPIARVAHSLRGVGDITLLDETRTPLSEYVIGSVPRGQVRLEGSATITIDGVDYTDDDGDEDTGDDASFVVVAGRKLWRMLGLR